MKKLSMFVFVALLSVGAVNYFMLQSKVANKIKIDERNIGIEVNVHYEWYVNPNTLVFDIRGVALDKSQVDVSRVLLQSAEALKNNEFERVILAHDGNEKFLLKGDFFKSIGQEYGTQNPMYTLRTFPQNVYNLDGTKAFPTWTGGMLGVLGKQMEDFSEFNKQWYLNSLVNSK
ncbi:conserved hypothetical protein [Photobacterium leiognathi lrivu.4.1]|uniref:Uncharacterized protein n=1 Tax=Photobacterium leiognathi lrivu.4.1 TaxID=1248232 RepID=A0A0U1P5U8_PHOLE|nr:hypothetical protein [Photobacterium leiognathi]GAD29939.1 conserved hypothetical protein [Photobacterium leiognathi lrivu.4.1]